MSEIIDTSTSAHEAETTANAVVENDSVEVEVAETTIDTQPVEPFRLARWTAAKNLAGQLETRFGMSPEAAAAIAYAVEDPSEARRQLQFPNRVRVPGGSLRTISARISAFNVVPHVVNGRVVGATAYPASVYAGDAPPKFWAERDLAVGDSGSAELVLKAKTRQQVVDGFEIASRELLAQNDLTQTIRDNGIFFPVTVVPIHVETSGDSEEPATTLAAIEGSSRTAATHRILGIDSSDPLYGPVASFRTARSRMQEVMAKLDLPITDVTAAELEHARAASVPAIIVVAYEADRDGADLLDALDAYVAFLHLDPPRQWSEPAKENKLADGVVDELVAANELTADEAEWYAGMVPPTEAATLGLPTTPDERASHILRKLTSSTATPAGKAVGKGVKRYTLQQRASKNPKALAAASLALRAHAGSRKKAVTTILGRTWEHRAFWRTQWEVTARTTEELRDAALAEVEAASGPGPATLELAARATYYLVTSGALATEEPGSFVNQRPSDKRTPANVLDAIMRSAHGVQLMYQAVVTGSLGSQPPRVDERGTVVVSAARTPIEATNAWLRETHRPLPNQQAATHMTAPVTPTMTPDHLLDTTLDSLEDDIDAVVARMKAVESVASSSGGSLVSEVGIDSPRTRDFRDKLDDVVRGLTKYELIWQMRNSDLVEAVDNENES